MRLGCGCLLLTLVVVACLGAITWGGVQMVGRPDDAPMPETSRDDALRAERKIYTIMSEKGRRTTRETIVLTESELNALLSRGIVDIGDTPVSDLATRFVGSNIAEIWGRLPLAYLLGDTPLASTATMLPQSLRERRLWIGLATHVRVEVVSSGRRYLRLDVTRFSIGRQRLPAVLARLLLDPTALRWLRWSLPAAIDDVRIEKGRAVVRTAA